MSFHRLLCHNQRETKNTGGEYRKLAARILAKWSGIIPVCGIIVVKRKITAELAVIFLKMVDLKRLELSTSRMRTERSPS